MRGEVIIETGKKDKIIKKRLYECVGIKEYFLISPEYKEIEKFELIDGKYQFVGDFFDGEFDIKCLNSKIDVSKIFEGVE